MNSCIPGKMFIGGLSWATTDQELLNYFQRFGDVTDHVIIKDKENGNSRGFGFVTFKNCASVQHVVQTGPHFLNQQKIDPKPCNVQPPANQRTSSPRTLKGFTPSPNHFAYPCHPSHNFATYGYTNAPDAALPSPPSLRTWNGFTLPASTSNNFPYPCHPSYNPATYGYTSVPDAAQKKIYSELAQLNMAPFQKSEPTYSSKAKKFDRFLKSWTNPGSL